MFDAAAQIVRKEGASAFFKGTSFPIRDIHELFGGVDVQRRLFQGVRPISCVRLLGLAC